MSRNPCGDVCCSAIQRTSGESVAAGPTPPPAAGSSDGHRGRVREPREGRFATRTSTRIVAAGRRRLSVAPDLACPLPRVETMAKMRQGATRARGRNSLTVTPLASIPETGRFRPTCGPCLGGGGGSARPPRDERCRTSIARTARWSGARSAPEPERPEQTSRASNRLPARHRCTESSRNGGCAARVSGRSLQMHRGRPFEHAGSALRETAPRQRARATAVLRLLYCARRRRRYPAVWLGRRRVRKRPAAGQPAGGRQLAAVVHSPHDACDHLRCAWIHPRHSVGPAYPAHLAGRGMSA